MRSAAGGLIVSAGEPDPDEYFVLSGIVKSFVGDAEGREVTLAFHVGSCALTPSIARVADGRSRVSCVAMTPARVAGFPSATFYEIEVADNDMRLHTVAGTWFQTELQRLFRARIHAMAEGLPVADCEQFLRDFC